MPADLKAAIRFRTHRGTILTNFDDKALVTRTEMTRHIGSSKKEKGSKNKNADKAAPDKAAADMVAPVAPVPAVGPDNAGLG